MKRKLEADKYGIQDVLNSFDATKGSFGYNEKNRHKSKYVISPMIKDDDISKEELESRYNSQLEHGQRELNKAKNTIKGEVGESSWNSLQTRFRKGDSRKAIFIDDDDEPQITSNRFTGINLMQELETAKQKKLQEDQAKNRQNAELNLTEWQHMDYNTSRADRATYEVIKDRRKVENWEKDYNREQETGNTKRITKEASIRENQNIIRRNDHSGTGHNVFSFKTTLMPDNSGNCVEVRELMAEDNINKVNSNTADVGDYKDRLASGKY